jgi:hypothetical protein
MISNAKLKIMKPIVVEGKYSKLTLLCSPSEQFNPLDSDRIFQWLLSN